MLPESTDEKRNRLGCWLILLAVILLIGVLATIDLESIGPGEANQAAPAARAPDRSGS